MSLSASGTSGESVADDVPQGRDESGIEAAGPGSGVDAAAVATANEQRDEKNPSGERSEVPAMLPREDQRAAVVASRPSSTTATRSEEVCSASLRTTAVLASPKEVDGESRPTTLSGQSPPPTAADLSVSTLPVAEAVAVPPGDRLSPTLLKAAAEAATMAATELVPRPSQSSRHEHALSLAAACSQDTVVGVARDLREYVEAVTRSRASRAAKGGDGGGGGGGKSAGPGGALGAGAGAAGENGLQEPPAEGLFDALLDQVLEALGDA